jgi:hypothetical protein
MPHLPFHPAPGLSDLAPGWFVLPQNPLTMGPSTVLVPTMAATAPGRWTRTPTLADLVQASFPVPQNPVVQNLVMGLQGLRGMRGCCGIGSDVWDDPWEGRPQGSQPQWGQGQWGQNQWTRFAGLGCGGGGCGQPYGLNGLGQTPGTDALSTWLAANGGSPGTWLADTQTLFGFTLPMWGWLAGGAAAAFAASSLLSKSGGRKRNPRRNPPGNRAIAGYGSTTMNPHRVITGYGSTVMNGSGKTNVVFNGRRGRRRNIQQGFWNATGFHPIRASKDYDPDRAGDEY